MAIAGLALTPAQSEPAPWKQFTPSLGDFSVLFPVEPEVNAKTSPKGIQSHSFTTPATFPSPAGYCIYHVSAYRYPPIIFGARQGFPGTFLDDSQKAQLRGKTLKPGSVRNLALGAFPGRELIFTDDKDVSTILRMLLVGAPPESFAEYHLKAVCSKGVTNPEQQAKPFLDSFQILQYPGKNFLSARLPWKEHSSSADRFSILFPAEPRVIPATGANGLQGRQYGAAFGTHAFMVAAFVYPYNSIDYTGFPNSLLDATQKGSLSAAKMTLRPGSQRPVTLQGQPGREYTADGEAQTVRARIQLRGKPPQPIAAYQVMVVNPKGLDHDGVSAEFLNSFKLSD